MDTEVDAHTFSRNPDKPHQGLEDASQGEVSTSIQSKAVDAEVVARSEQAVREYQQAEGLVRTARAASHQRRCEEARAGGVVQESRSRVAQGADRRRYVRLSERC